MMTQASNLDMFRIRYPRRVLVLAPHPDDEAIGCGGYLAALSERGADIIVVFVTDGELGPAGPDASLAATRRAESEKAGSILNVRQIVRWRFPDGGLSQAEPPTHELNRLVRELEIEMILAPHRYESHPDHRAVAGLVAHVDGLAHAVEVMSYEVWTPLAPNRIVNVSGQAERKLRAIGSYSSQTQRWNLEQLACGLMQYRAAWSGMHWQYAECFRCSSLQEYREGCHAD